MAAERLLDYIECQLGITGHAIAETILSLLQKKHLDPKLLRGQGYDSASNMAGKVKKQQLLSPLNIHLLSTFMALLTSSI